MKKIIYIDESGISSNTGYSVYVCLYVEFSNHLYLADKIVKIEKQLKISYTHWTEMPWKLRVKFTEKIKLLDFKVKAISYKNPILPDYVLKGVLVEFIQINSDILKIVIDGKKNKNYERELKGLLRNKGIKVYDLKIIDDKKESLVRLSDFIAGLIRSYLNNSDKNSAKIFNLLKNKIEINHKIKTSQ